MAFKKRGRDPASEHSSLVRKFYWEPLWTLAKLLAVPAIPIVLMLIYGQPGLRIQYWYVSEGANYRVYSRCQYWTVFDGWKDIRPGYGMNQCPLVGWFPFHLNQLIGG